MGSPAGSPSAGDCYVSVSPNLIMSSACSICCCTSGVILSPWGLSGSRAPLDDIPRHLWLDVHKLQCDDATSVVSQSRLLSVSPGCWEPLI